MNIDATREEFENLDYFAPTDEFNGIVILPSATPQPKEEPKADKALNLLAEWAIECGFGYDNIPEEYEKYKDDIAEIGYAEGLVYIVKMESEVKK